MPTFTMDVGLVLERRKAKSKWIDVIWEAHAVLPSLPAVETGAILSRDGDSELFYAGATVLEAHTVETQFYRDNVMSGSPRIWVVLRPQPGDSLPEIVKATCDPTEGEGYTETGWDIVNMVPMPEAVRHALIAFIEEHHVERPFYKRKRDKADPEALAVGRKGPDRDRFLRELRKQEDGE
jgi:hypothetical protein